MAGEFLPVGPVLGLGGADQGEGDDPDDHNGYGYGYQERFAF